jgi:hypothetical protein
VQYLICRTWSSRIGNHNYQVIVRRGRECGVEVFPHRFRHHFSHTWLDRGGAEGRPDGAQRLDLPARCSTATVPAPTAPEHATATTASWTTRRYLTRRGLSLQASHSGGISALWTADPWPGQPAGPCRSGMFCAAIFEGYGRCPRRSCGSCCTYYDQRSATVEQGLALATVPNVVCPLRHGTGPREGGDRTGGAVRDHWT